MVHILQLFLEDGKKQHQQGNSGENHQSKLCIHLDHHEDHTDEIGNTPCAVNEPPADETSDAARIAHQSGVDIADTVLVEIGKG